MHAYNELYLNDAMNNLGNMMEYAVYDCGYEPQEFFEEFVSSGIGEKFGKGNPRYVAGLSGVELVSEVVKKSRDKYLNKPVTYFEFKGKEYWAGWIMAYYQWYRNMRFEDMIRNGLDMERVISMYILHEADVSKFVDVADEIIEKCKKDKISNLQRIRKFRGITQKKLSEESGVTLRMIQLYEQRQNDINKAQAEVVLRLANVLGCKIEDLME